MTAIPNMAIFLEYEQRNYLTLHLYLLWLYSLRRTAKLPGMTAIPIMAMLLEEDSETTWKDSFTCYGHISWGGQRNSLKWQLYRLWPYLLRRTKTTTWSTWNYMKNCSRRGQRRDLVKDVEQRANGLPSNNPNKNSPDSLRKSWTGSDYELEVTVTDSNVWAGAWKTYKSNSSKTQTRLCSLIRVFAACMKKLLVVGNLYIECQTKTVTRLHDCAGWSVSSLCAHVLKNLTSNR